MIARLMDVLGGSFSTWQFGFQTRKCTEDAWIHVKRCVNDADSQYVLGIFIDFKGAFDHLEWSAIIKRLQDVGCQELKIWRHYFSDKTANAMSSTGSVDGGET